MEAIGKDGEWHDWDDLTEEERKKWMAGLTEADRIWDARKRGEYFSQTLQEKLMDYEISHRLI